MVKAAAVLMLVLLRAGAAWSTTDYLQLIKDTPCAVEYRLWFFSFRRTDFFVAPPPFTQEECDKAAKVSHEIDDQQRAEQLAAQREHVLAEINRGYQQHLAEQRAAELKAKSRPKAAPPKEKPGAYIGMTPQQVINDTNWGKPKSINRTTTAAGTSEQWVYGIGTYLYFDNDRLTSIQQAR